MIFRLMGAYLTLEGLGSLLHFWNGRGDKKNKVFQLGRVARIVFGVMLVLFG